MKLICISDTHGLHNQINENQLKGDILVVAGDISNVGNKQDIKNFNWWLREKVQCKYKIVIAGNHDWCFANSNSRKSVEWLTEGDENIIYLQDSAIIIDGIKFYGSPWQPEFCNWAFNLKRGKELQEIWAKIPTDIDVLITHGPPKGILDPGSEGYSVGCADLMNRVLEVKPKVHIFGHTHNGYGIWHKMNEIIYVNAATCNETYIPENKPIVIEI